MSMEGKVTGWKLRLLSSSLAWRDTCGGFVTDHLVVCSEAGSETGKQQLLKFGDFWVLTTVHFTSSMLVPLVVWSICPHS